MDGLTSGIESIQNGMMMVGLGILGIMIVSIGIKFLVKGQRQFDSFIFEAIALFVGVILMTLSSAISSWMQGLF